MMIYLAFIFLVIFAVYEKVRRPMVCIKKINQYVDNLGGYIIDAKKIDERTEAYFVKYMVGSEEKSYVVKFNFFYKMIWE